MRRAGDIPFDWIADNTRWVRKPRTFTDLNACIDDTEKSYRRDLWEDQDEFVEIWLEKDAISGVVSPITSRFHVPLMVTRGYSSLTFLYEAAEGIGAQDKPAYVYYLGDHDPSGVDIPRKVENGLREHAPEAKIHFRRIAVNPDQIQQWKLPARPTKKSDTRSRTFAGESVEVDAIPPDDLRELVERVILDHIDQQALAVTRAAEESERSLLRNWAANLSMVGR